MLQRSHVLTIPKFGPIIYTVRVTYREQNGQTQTVSHGTRPEGRTNQILTLSGWYFDFGIPEIRYSY